MLSYLRELVDESRAAHAAAKAIAAAPAAAVARPMPAPAGGDEFKRVNAAAMAALGAWVPALFPGAIERGGRYRLTSKMLGRDLQEDLSIRPDGIVDFGVHDLGDANEGRRTPIDLVVEWGHKTPKDALHWLAGLLGITLSAPPRRQRPARAVPPPPPDDGDAPKDESPPDEADNVIPIGRAKRARAPGKGEGAKPAAKKKVPKDVWELVDALCERFVLIYSTDQAWDRAELMIVRIAAMRLAFGKVPVNLWLSRSTRQMIRPIDLVFEPGQEPAPPAVNMFGGLALQPQACADAEVAPMLDLLRHLCSESVLAPQPAGGRPEGAADDVDAVMHWVLCWIALPLQRLGTKMATACVFHGAQGTGKNAFWDVWRDLFGVYGITVSQTELEDKFNAWVSRKLAIIGDEVVSRQEMYHNKNRLKLIVTQQDKFPIRGMQQETRWESNHANVVFLSNESQPLALEERDRRYMVIYTPLEADAALYETAKAFRASGGAAKWLHYLLHYPVGDFGAHTKPLMTQAKEDLIRAAWKPAVQFANDWLEGLIELPVRVCSVEQLYRAFRRWCDNTGAKWPPDQAGFTGEVNRWVRERVRRLPNGQYEEPRLIYKPIALAADGLRHRRTVRCWLPTGTGAPNGVSEGQWALESVEQFERDLRTYCRPRGLATEEES
ncbi:MAG TPA: DUF5906 domain-containing protein [Rubrivivax sp.]|nr:DUF5906 domain-containing protein [Rubrivivax sp.]